MIPFRFHKELSFSILCLLGIASLTACLTKSNRFGIVFSYSEEVGDAGDLYQMADHSRNEYERLTFTPTINERSVLVSEDGENIVFTTNRLDWGNADPAELEIEPLDHIFLLGTTNKTLKDLTDIFESQPFEIGSMPVDFSRDKNRFAIITGSGQPGIMNFDGGNKELLSIGFSDEIPYVIDDIRWSPDEKKLAFIHSLVGVDKRLQNPGSALVIYDIETGELRQIADHNENCYHVTWSPTGWQLAATCVRAIPYSEYSGPYTVRIFGAENTDQRPAYEYLALTSCWSQSWSYDGKKLAFVCRKEDDQEGLFVINSDGSGLREIKLGDLKPISIVSTPFWSPIGDQIVYVAGNDNRHLRIYMINSDGSNKHPLTVYEADYHIKFVYPTP
jgi:Tol biopolymer transport system component